MKYQTTKDLLSQEVLTYSQILNIKRRLTGYSNLTGKHRDEAKEAYEKYMREEYQITSEHTEKGLEYLYRVSFKPSIFGSLEEAQEYFIKHNDYLDNAVRKTCPLGYREVLILLNFDHFTFTGFYDDSTYYMSQAGYKSLYPLWTCYDKDGDSFEYYIAAGAMHIVG